MGWASGTELAERIYIDIRGYIEPGVRTEVARRIYEDFCDYDADAWDGSSLLEQDAGVNQEGED